LKWLINISWMLLLPLFAYTQTDTTKLSFKKYYLPTGIRVGTDLIALSRNFYDDTFTGWEANVDVDMYRYYIAIDYGNWGRHYEDDGLLYTNDGNYFRAGVDVNFLTKDPQRNMFFVGARYGTGTFNEEFYFLEPDGPILERNSNVPAHWYELTSGIRVKIWSFLWMGYTARFKFGLKHGETLDLEPHDIPGYGRTDKPTTWGFNYQIFFRIPVRQMPPLPPAKKKKKSSSPPAG
jgi:hypothetical protein